MEHPTAHVLLRDRRDWYGTLRGLVADRDGALALERVPAPFDGKAVDVATAYPYAREVSGLALGPRGAVFVADTAGNRVVYVDGLCDSRAIIDAPGGFLAPRGIALGATALRVADSGRSRVQDFALPHLEANRAWSLWARPVSIAMDSRQRLLVVDDATATVRRASAAGAPDTAFDTTIAAQGKLQRPLFLACDSQGRVFVADSQADAVFVFADDGRFSFELSGPPGWRPGALAVHGTRVYVADAANGAIRVFDVGAATPSTFADVAGYRGPVTALAVGDDGDLYIKPGLDSTYYRFEHDSACIASGELIAGPFDAGLEREWERAWADVEIPPGASVAFAICTGATTATPAPGDWTTSPSLDALLAVVTSAPRRYVWLRLTLTGGTDGASPRIRQARVATATEDLRDYLPLTYRRHDRDAAGFLSRWLKLVRGEFARIEESLDDIPRIADANRIPASSLGWLSQWLAFELPQIADDDERRALLARAVPLLARRGTRDSIAEFVEMHTGIRPTIVEAFHDRRIWELGRGLGLGFDSRLPALDPLGMVLPDPAAGAGCCPDPTETAGSCQPCARERTAPGSPPPVHTPIGRAVVGESGPLAAAQIGLPLFAEEAYRFCVIVDGYRACDPGIRAEIARIIEREKPAHTDYRIEYVDPDLRIGMQSRIGVDAIVGGDPPPLRLGAAALGHETRLPPSDVARVGVAALDGMLTLT